MTDNEEAEMLMRLERTRITDILRAWKAGQIKGTFDQILEVIDSGEVLEDILEATR